MIVLYILLWLLLAVLAVIIILLTVPLRYRAEAGFGEDTCVTVRATWLLHLVRLRFTYQGGQSEMSLRIAWYDPAKRAAKRRGSAAPAKTPESPAATPETSAATPESPAATAAPAETPKTPAETAAPAKHRHIWPFGRKKSPPKDTARADKKESLPARLYKLLTEYGNKSIINIGIQFIKKTAHALQPDRLYAEGVFGFEDPAVTGVVLGIFEAVAGCYRLRPSVNVRGDFTRPVFEMDASVAGRLRVGRILWPLVWLCTRKPIFNLLFKKG